MLISKEVITTWTNSNKKTYTNKGYIFTKNGDKVNIKIQDLSKYCTLEVDVKCDYCNKIHKKRWSKFLRGREIINKDACRNCQPKKQQDIYLLKNGVSHWTQTEEGRKINADLTRKYTIKDIKELFQEVNYELITTEYYNNAQKLQYICPKHGLKEITLGHFLSGERCKECFYENNSGKNNNKW